MPIFPPRARWRLRIGASSASILVALAIMFSHHLKSSSSNHSLIAMTPVLNQQEPSPQDQQAPAAQSSREALGRAMLLHDAINGSLQVVHRDFFNDESPRILPSQSLDDVFAEIKERFDVEIRWLTGNADEMNTDHRPNSEFEREAIKQIIEGAPHVTQEKPDSLQWVGAIVLRSQCLKCHVSRRTSLEDRFSALSITIPVRSESADE